MDPVETTTGVDASQAASNAVEDTDNHTPPTPPQAPPAPGVPSPTSDTGLTELRTIVEGLATSVATLTEAVAHMLPPDKSVTKRVPWTHRGGKVAGDE